jgi:NAD dependent epimerase/dehydratase family enzyme
VVSPEPVRQRDFAHLLGRLLHRPVLPAPVWALHLAVGEFADEALLVGQRVRPKRLTEARFPYQWPALEPFLKIIMS